VPGLGKELDEELGILGHEENSVGDLVTRIIDKLYEIYGDGEFNNYLNKYRVRDMLESADLHTEDFIPVIIENGVAQFCYRTYTLSYFEFVERFSPVMFLGLAKLKYRNYNEYCSYRRKYCNYNYCFGICLRVWCLPR
jgi:hypothetical protein